MQGQIIVEKTTGRRWLYVPEVHIQFQVLGTGDESLIVAAFRTDGHYRAGGVLVPTVEFLHLMCQFTTEVDVPEHIVEFAVESERQRQELVGGIENTLRGILHLDIQPERSTALPRECVTKETEPVQADEDEIAREIQILMAKAGGLS